MTSDTEILEEDKVMNLTPPPPGYLIRALSVAVDLSLSWEKAVNRAGPQTPKSTTADFGIRDIGKLFPPSQDRKKIDLVLVSDHRPDTSSAARFWSIRTACRWARQVGLKPTEPREVFAIGCEHSLLNEEMLIDATDTPMAIHSTSFFHFRGSRNFLCSLHWGKAGRWVDIYGLPQFALSDNTSLVAFRR